MNNVHVRAKLRRVVYFVYGIVLEGGGAKGAYQIGAWKALTELGIEFSGVVGTSIGAINAALMIQNDFKVAYELWNKVDSFYAGSLDTDFKNEFISYEFNSYDPSEMKKEMKAAFGLEGIDIEPFRKGIKAIIKEDKIRNSKQDFGLVTISQTKKKGLKLFIEDIPFGQLSDYVVASCYLPIFKSMQLNGDYFMDGSYYDRLPTDMLIKKGYKNIIEIRLYSPKKDENRNIFGSDVNIITIQPREYLGKTIDFNRESIMKNIRLGYFDTLRVFRGYQGKRYYIETNVTEELLSLKLSHFNEETIEKVKRLLLVKEAIHENLQKWVIRGIIEKLSLKENSTYTDFTIGVMEYLAEQLDIDRFCFYTYDELLDLLKEKIALFYLGEIAIKQDQHNLINACIEIIKYL